MSQAFLHTSFCFLFLNGIFFSLLFGQEDESNLLNESWKMKQGANISLECNNQKISTVFKEIAEKAGVNLFYPNDLRGMVTLRLNKVKWFEAVQVLIETHLPEYHLVQHYFNIFQIIPRYEKKGKQGVLLARNFDEKISNIYITLGVRDNELQQILNYLCERSGLEIKAPKDFKPKISINLKDTPLLTALQILALKTKCRIRQISKEKLQFERIPLISFNCKAVLLKKVIELISFEKEINLVYVGEVKGKVTCSFKNVFWKDALEVILATKGYELVAKAEKVYIIQPKKIAMDFYVPTETRAFLFTFETPLAEETLSRLNAMLSKQGRLFYTQKPHQIIVSETYDKLEKISVAVKKINITTENSNKQILLKEKEETEEKEENKENLETQPVKKEQK